MMDILTKPEDLYMQLDSVLVGEDLTPHPHAEGDCQLVTTSFVVNGCKAWAVRVSSEKRAFAVLLDAIELRQIAARAIECADELENC